MDTKGNNNYHLGGANYANAEKGLGSRLVTFDA